MNPPLITGDPDKKLIDVSCDSELHLLLGIIHIWFICLNYCEGIVEKIMREFEKRVFPSPDFGKDFMSKFLKQVCSNFFDFLYHC